MSGYSMNLATKTSRSSLSKNIIVLPQNDRKPCGDLQATGPNSEIRVFNLEGKLLRILSPDGMEVLKDFTITP